MRSFFPAILAAFVAASAAQASDVTVSVATPDGRPVQDAVVTLHAPGGHAAAPIRFSWSLTMAQHNIAFEPS